MNEDTLNRSLRRFLKTVGVNTQREVEAAVRAAAASGKLPGKPLQATAEIRIEELDFRFEVEAPIEHS